MGIKTSALGIKLGTGRLKKSGVSEKLQEVKLAAWVSVRLCEAGGVCVPAWVGKKGLGLN